MAKSRQIVACWFKTGTKSRLTVFHFIFCEFLISLQFYKVAFYSLVLLLAPSSLEHELMGTLVQTKYGENRSFWTSLNKCQYCLCGLINDPFSWSADWSIFISIALFPLLECFGYFHLAILMLITLPCCFNDSFVNTLTNTWKREIKCDQRKSHRCSWVIGSLQTTPVFAHE